MLNKCDYYCVYYCDYTVDIKVFIVHAMSQHLLFDFIKLLLTIQFITAHYHIVQINSVKKFKLFFITASMNKRSQTKMSKNRRINNQTVVHLPKDGKNSNQSSQKWIDSK